MAEASRFGILNTNPDDSIYEFDEKPKVPKSTKASMGIYVFSWNKLKEYLIADEKDKSSSNDFGKNVLPAMLNAGERMFAYEFQGYWTVSYTHLDVYKRQGKISALQRLVRRGPLSFLFL